MSKAGYIARYGTIYQFLERNPYSSYERLIEVLEARSETLRDRNFRARMGISKRTIQRDLQEMESLFGIVVAYDRSRKGLVLKENGHALLHNFQQLVESSALTNVLVEGSRYAPYLKLSGKPYRGLENLPEYLEAITHRRHLRIDYAPFEGTPARRTVAPYQIREYDGRWYLIAHDTADDAGVVKCFALDRIEEHALLNSSFKAPELKTLDGKYQPCLGITTPDAPAIAVTLSFDRQQAPYVRTLPLHPSQEIVAETKKQLVVRIEVYDTWELRARIRSYGASVEVLAPESLREGIRQDLKRAAGTYRKKRTA